MKPYTKHTGMVAPLDKVNVDTDQMVPKQFLKLCTREGFGRILFYDWREGFVYDLLATNQPARYEAINVKIGSALRVRFDDLEKYEILES